MWVVEVGGYLGETLRHFDLLFRYVCMRLRGEKGFEVVYIYVGGSAVGVICRGPNGAMCGGLPQKKQALHCKVTMAE